MVFYPISASIGAYACATQPAAFPYKRLISLTLDKIFISELETPSFANLILPIYGWARIRGCF